MILIVENKINMKSVFFVIVGSLLALAAADYETPTCNVNPVKIHDKWVTMRDTCKTAMRSQIQMEVDASLRYLAMGAHFSRDVINRPGFAKLFFEAAGEEREHAMKLIEYLLMRGELTSDVSGLITFTPHQLSKVSVDVPRNGTDALERALQMEHDVTSSIRRVIIACEDGSKDDQDPRKFNDYHLVDYLTGEFLEEQYKGQRDLAGKASTLKKMMEIHGRPLAEFIFDKKLLGMDI